MELLYVKRRNLLYQVILDELQLTPRELEFDIIKELLETQNREKEHLRGYNSSISFPVVGVSDF